MDAGRLDRSRLRASRVISVALLAGLDAADARYGGQALLQLDCSICFPERPEGPGWNLLGGRLDGVLWRVTLGRDGVPWVYDTIHLCGCNHLFFPTARAAARPQPDDLDEKAFVPQLLPRVEPRARIVVRLRR